MNLDLQILSFSSILASIVSSVFFILVWRLNPNMPGIGLWLLAVIGQPISTALTALRDIIPNWISILVSNSISMWSLLLIYLGARVFFGKQNKNWKIFLLTTCTFIPVFSYFIYIEPNIIARIYIAYAYSFVFICLSGHCAFSLKSDKQTIGSKIYGFICLFIAAVVIVRLLTLGIFDVTVKLYELSISNFFGPFLAYFVPSAITLSVFILCYEKRELDVKKLELTATQEVKLKNNMLTTLSHELRTPLNGIVGLAQLMKPKVNDKSLIDDLNTIIKSGNNLATLSTNILEYAVSESKNIHLKPANINVMSLISELSHLLTPMAKNKDLTLNITAPSDFPESLLIDADKLHSILINLVDNAIKYTDEGTITIHAHYQKQINAQYLITLSVSDTGSGMSEEEQSSLLLPFARAEQVLSKQQGSGVGLALTTKLLQAMDSTLEVSSQLHVGTKMAFSILCDKGAPNPITKQPANALLQALNILLVEDGQLNIDVVTAMLVKNQHSVHCATTGQQAIAMCINTQFDLILLDMQLPDCHGTEVLSEIRSQGWNINTPVIVLTAAVTPKDKAIYNQLPVSSVVEKPIMEDTLALAISASQSQTFNIAESTGTSAKPVIFDCGPFIFLQSNLSKQQLNLEIQKLPEYISTSLSTILELDDEKLIDKHLHKLTSYIGQFGMLQLAKAIQQLDVSSFERKQFILNSINPLVDISITNLMHYFEVHND
ncbi:hypothetical protein GARC_5303 [Paraglaciecola arctica BSs20135]|uniref:histidine kinase n=1 Tax=Paraglaciecola arctica BSs20135 TaxID=493475 RepID=K6YZQ7_9ALTE|nr:hypothetical protein GARC_5303 [Paraglaciecola arctica BSs20135]